MYTFDEWFRVTAPANNDAAAEVAARTQAERFGLRVEGEANVQRPATPDKTSGSGTWVYDVGLQVVFDLPFHPRRLTRDKTDFLTADDQPYDLFVWQEPRDEQRGWHRVTRLAAGDYLGVTPWVFTVCRPDSDEHTPTVDADDLTTSWPTMNRCPECFGEAVAA